MDPRKPVLETLVETFGREEATLAELLRLADQMRDALIASDLVRLDVTASRMGEAGDILEGLARERQQLVSGIVQPPHSIEATVALADELGIPALGHCRARLASLALDLQNAQERNAQLILGAVRTRERWFNILAGMIAPTYGARGRQNVEASRRFVSKSA